MENYEKFENKVVVYEIGFRVRESITRREGVKIPQRLT